MMSADKSLFDEHAKKWLVEKKKEINERREYEAARAVVAAAEHGTRQVEHAARIQAE